MSLLRNFVTSFQSSNRQPVERCKSVADKEAFAQWIVESFFRNGSANLEAALERQADLRLCSLVSRHISSVIFGPSGNDVYEQFKAISEAVGYELEIQKSGRLADTGTSANVITPAKYRGFGATLDRPDARGHIYQVNMLSFPWQKPIIGIAEYTGGDTIYPTKGMREVGRRNIYRLFELDPELSDDMTALLIKPDRGDTRVEFAYLRSIDDTELNVVYRHSTVKNRQ